MVAIKFENEIDLVGIFAEEIMNPTFRDTQVTQYNDPKVMH